VRKEVPDGHIRRRAVHSRRYPEQLLDTARRAKGGFLVEIATTIHDGIA